MEKNVKIFALSTSDSKFKELCNQVGEYHSVLLYDEIKAFLQKIDECDAVLLDLDANQKQADKLIKTFKSKYQEIIIIGAYNEFDSKKLAKHKKSELAANFYIHYPVESSQLEKIFKINNLDTSDNTGLVAIEVLKGHQKKEVSETAQQASDKLDNVFATAFSEEYENRNEEIDMSNHDEDTKDEDATNVLDLGDMDSLDLAAGDDAGALDLDDGGVLDLGDDAGEFDLGNDTGALDLGDDASGIDLAEGLGMENLDFGEGDLNLTEFDSEQAPAQEEGLDLSGDTGLDLGAAEEVLTSTVVAPDLSLDSDEIDMGTGMDFTIPDEFPNTSSENETDQESIGQNNAHEGGFDPGSDIGLDLGEEQDQFTGTIQGGELDRAIEAQTHEDSTIVGVGIQNDPNESATRINIEAQDFLNQLNLEAEGELDDIETKMQQIDDLLQEGQKSVAAEEQDVLEAVADVVVNETTEADQDETRVAVEAIAPTPELPTSTPTVNTSTVNDHQEYKIHYDSELVRLGETIKSLRQDREILNQKITELEEKNNTEKRDFLNLQAQLDEKKIELSVLKSRYSKQVEEQNLKLDLLANKKEVLQEQNRGYEQEFQKLKKQKNVDVNMIRARERELEEKLDLLRKDAEVQIRNRDHKILELKRRIDTLEFDIENANMKEQKTQNQQEVMEDKMYKVITTLRQAIGHLEEDDPVLERKKIIKKNMDV